jgi:hypothetical protein
MYDVILIQGTWQQLNTQLKDAMDVINADKKKTIVNVSHSSNTASGVVNYSVVIITYLDKK